MSHKIFKHYDKAALNQQYDIEVRDEWDKHEIEYLNLSEQARRAFPGTFYNIQYGSGENERLDIFPAKQSDAPVLFFIHGGYWREGDMALWHFIASGIVGNNVTLVLPTYDISKETRIGTIVEQMRSAFLWTVDHIADYGGDPESISISGHSAGAQLAAMLLTENWPARSYRNINIKSAILLSGLFDLRPIQLCPYLKDGYGIDLTNDEVESLSPYKLPLQVKCPIKVLVGANETEEYLRNSQLLVSAWNKQNDDIEHQLITNHHHFSLMLDLADPKTFLSKTACA